MKHLGNPCIKQNVLRQRLKFKTTMINNLTDTVFSYSSAILFDILTS